MNETADSFNKEKFEAFFSYWSEKRLLIEKAYDEHNTLAIEMMNDVIVNYENLLALAETEMSLQSGLGILRISPMNGQERLQFVKDNIHNHRSFIQLDALYLETKKGIARSAAIAKKRF